MPTKSKPFKRTWCKSCQDYTVFSKKVTEDAICKTCETPYAEYSLDEVPAEKIEEQRVRYKDYKKREFLSMMNMYNNVLGSIMSGEMDSPGIPEDDAGQIAIDTAIRAEREAKRAAELEFKSRFRGLQRNEKCRCGSEKKYKKCCLPLVEKIR
jgi:hypothetical protein